MNHSVTEQTAMFFTLCLFYAMISCYIVTFKREKDKLYQFFKKRINDPRFSDNWKLIFFASRYVQAIVLLTLFLNGISDINNMKNLGFMVFFVVYTAYEEVYRKTSRLLTLFISMFIVTQYAFSFFYKMVLNSKDAHGRYTWAKFVPYKEEYGGKDPFHFGENENMYGRLAPQKFDWMILIMMSLLYDINTMYLQKDKIAALQELTRNILR